MNITIVSDSVSFHFIHPFTGCINPSFGRVPTDLTVKVQLEISTILSVSKQTDTRIKLKITFKVYQRLNIIILFSYRRNEVLGGLVLCKFGI